MAMIDPSTIIGKKFGKLVAIELLPWKRGKLYVYLCLCNCGVFTSAVGVRLTTRKKKSCGCLTGHPETKNRLTHGMSKSAEYKIWEGIMSRCYNHKVAHFKNYGGRGITVHERYHSFINFYNDVGPRPTSKHTIDRIDNNRGYEPGNLRWATRQEQGLNKRNIRLITIRGQTKPLIVWAEENGICSRTLYSRLNAGWKEERLLDPADNR